jgi:uncharacterized membrane protein
MTLAPEFRLRGLQTTRLETLTDAAFAFAFTLLVIGQGKLPANYVELWQALLHIPAFVCSIALLGVFWFGHHLWSRRTGMDDGITTVLSFGLVLTVLVYVYPIKAVFSSMFHALTGGLLPTGIQLSTFAELSGLFVIYGLGFALMCCWLILLHWHALRKHQQLALTLWEKTVLTISMQAWILMATIGLISAILAATLPKSLVVYSGYFYASLSAVMPIFGLYSQRRYQAVKRQLAANPPASL